MNRVIIFDFNRTVFDPARGCLFSSTPHVLATLSKRGYQLYLLSHIGNDSKRRTSRIKEIKSTDLHIFFENRIILTREKICATCSASYARRRQISRRVMWSATG